MENEILISHALDLARDCRENYIIRSTSFLDISEIGTLRSAISKCDVRHEFYGGYDEAERCVCLFLPEYAYDAETYFSSSPDDCPIGILRCKARPGSPPLSHRDYLGALTALGIKREKLGDIIVYDGGADVIFLREIEKFLLSEFSSAGRVKLQTCALPINELRAPEIRTSTERGTVASLRLDALISEAFSLSREKASEAIETGLVFVNSAKIQKSDAKISEGSKLVLRGKGKVIFKEVAGQTRRGRISVVFERYL